MRVLVTGAGGFVGRHVVAELAAGGHEVLGMDQPDVALAGVTRAWSGDLRDAAAVAQIIREASPDGCIHLAGIAYVPLGWTDPARVFSVNATGTLNLLEAFRAEAPRARIVAVTSAEIYGLVTDERPLAEDAPLRPANLYAVSKLAADLSTRLYAERYHMAVVTARPGNHIGPGQSSQFVATGFAEQVAAIAAGRAESVVRVGNLDSRRDFMDVRDVAGGYRRLLEKGRSGAAYNLASGRQITIREILDGLCRLAGISPRIEVEAGRFRPADASPRLDCSAIARETGWAPQWPLEVTLRDILADARRRLGQTG